jgi:hypothetical protein
MDDAYASPRVRSSVTTLLLQFRNGPAPLLWLRR